MKELTEQEKKDYIISKGWTTLWNANNWVHSTIMAGANLDWCGLDLNSAYRCQINNENKTK